MNAQTKACNESNKTDIITASLSSKNTNKLNKVGIVSFNEKLQANILKICTSPKIYTVTYSDGV